MGVIDICLQIFRILSDSPLTILLATAVHEYTSNIMSQPHYCAMRCARYAYSSHSDWPDRLARCTNLLHQA